MSTHSLLLLLFFTCFSTSAAQVQWGALIAPLFVLQDVLLDHQPWTDKSCVAQTWATFFHSLRQGGGMLQQPLTCSAVV